MNFQIIDVDTYFGNHPSRPGDLSLDALLDAERRQGVAYAMAYSLRGVSYSATAGNDHALEAANEHPEILPVATLDPREHYTLEGEMERISTEPFVAVRLNPDVQGWTIDSLLFRRALRMINAHEMPVLISASTAGTASQIVKASEGTKVPIILTGITYFTYAEAVAAILDSPNIYISTQMIDVPYAAEMMVATGGIDRYVFGSNSPGAYTRPSLSVILRSELSDEDKQKILSGNIQKILGKRAPMLDRTGDGNAYDNWTISRPIIDSHCHWGHWPFPIKTEGVPSILEMMRKNNIEKCILSSSEAIVSDFVRGNREMAEAIEGHPELYAYVTVNPNYFDRSCREMDEYLKKPNFIGVKIHPAYCGQSINSELTKALAHEIEKRNVPLLIHTMGAGEPSKVLDLAKHCPNLNILMGHGGATAWRESIEVMKQVPNIFTEFCASYCDRGKVEESVRQVGADRILFGSDMDLIAPEYVIGMYEEAGLSEGEQEKVMYANTKRLFGI